jgi:hypothetical protein
MLKSKGKTCMVEEPSHVKQLSLNHVCQIGLITAFIYFSDNCSVGMVESGYSYEGLPDPASYYPDSSTHSPDFGCSDHHQPSSRPPSQHQLHHQLPQQQQSQQQPHHQLPQQQLSHHQLPQQQLSHHQLPQQQPSYQQPVEGLQTPNTRAKRVVHEVIV